MKKWFRRQPKPPLEVQVNHRGLVVEHQIRKMPDPHPTMMWLVITNMEGQQFRTSPVPINGRSSYQENVNRYWVTGDSNDHGYFKFHVEMSYE